MGFTEKYKPILLKILCKSHCVAANVDRADNDWKFLSAKLKKVMKWAAEVEQNESSNDKLQHMVSTELSRILAELNQINEDKFKVLCQFFWSYAQVWNFPICGLNSNFSGKFAFNPKTTN